jgi:regulator of sigma E protease
MEVFVSVVLFVVIFSLLILIHEFGHFFVARRNGIRVEEFSLGLPPRAVRLYTDSKGTDYSIGWIPFGGFVRMFGEDESDEGVLSAKDSFAYQGKWARTKVVLAGVFVNYLFAFLILWGLFFTGVEPFILDKEDFVRNVQQGVILTEPGVDVVGVLEGSPAFDAGFEPGDAILAFNGTSAINSAQLIRESKPLAGSDVEYEVKRGDDVLFLTVGLGDDAKIGVQISDLPIVKEIQKIRLGFFASFLRAGYESTRLTWATVDAFGGVVTSLFKTGDVPDGIAGPVGIAAMTHNIAQRGFVDVLKFVSLLSLSLAAINVLPIPALDGGRFLFIVVESIRGKRISADWEAKVHALGFLLLILLILFVTYKDILSLIGA